MATFTATSSNASVGYSADFLDSIPLNNLSVLNFSSTSITVSFGAGSTLTYLGNNFALQGSVITGTMTGYAYHVPSLDVVASGLSISMVDLVNWENTGNDAAYELATTGGNDSAFGSIGSDMVDIGRGNDTVFGNAGNDTIEGNAGNDYLRGDDGNDSIVGGADFDDINGNRGNDTASGGDGDDWVVGGQDSDLLHGDNGFDIVYGNLGNDTIYGDAGADWVRGGQGDDLVFGGDGNDWLWGDRGNDTISGGAGADLFHSFSGAGLDRITDFSYAQGDRVLLDDRTAYAITQVGGDAVITIGGVDQVVLVGVTASSLASDAVIYV